MERQNNTKAQQNIKYRLLACVVAVALAIGLSAMPALAEPSEDASGSISIVSVDTSTDAKAEKADAPKGESGTSDSSSKAEGSSNKSDSSTSAKKPVSSDVLNPAEKLGAVLEGEGQAAVSNATGLSVASEESDEELDEKEQAKKNIKAAITAMGNYVATYYGDLVIDKTFISGPLYTVLDEQGNAVAAQYTVQFTVVGYRLGCDIDTATSDDVVYKKRTIGIKVDVGGGTNHNTATLEGLPEGQYVVTEIEYPGCGYECQGNPRVVKTIEWTSSDATPVGNNNKLENPIEFSFKNKGTGTNYPNQGFVNHYTDHGDTGFGWTAAERD